jgi:hypothetical protein
MPSPKEMPSDLESFFGGGTSPVLAVVLHEGLAPAVGDLLYLVDRIDVPHTGETGEDDKLTTSPAQEALGRLQDALAVAESGGARSGG